MTDDGRDDPVARLWRWFEVHARELGDLGAEEIDSLNRLVDAVGPFDWEVGPDAGGAFFALSTRGRREALEELETMVARAPRVQGWRFIAGKPPREWALRFTVPTDAGEVEIDGQRWELVMYRLPGGLVDIALLPPADPPLSDDEAQDCATILVEGELGERLRLAVVHDVYVVRTWGPKATAAARRLESGLLGRLLSGRN